MPKLKAPISLATTFADYTVDEILGEGGAGRVYGGVDSDGMEVAVKLLTNATSDKRKRFKNEIAFLARNRHANVVAVIDHGLANQEVVRGPFYVMRRYTGSLRGLMNRGIVPQQVLPLFSQILDGVECAHLQNVVHRDLKPENILYDNNMLAVADFGIASFLDDVMATLVDTSPAQRLANFLYAAPEQRMPGHKVTVAADIYALGLILNEMFTKAVPHGTEYLLIGGAAPGFGFLDTIVAQMIRPCGQTSPRCGCIQARRTPRSWWRACHIEWRCGAAP